MCITSPGCDNPGCKQERRCENCGDGILPILCQNCRQALCGLCWKEALHADLDRVMLVSGGDYPMSADEIAEVRAACLIAVGQQQLRYDRLAVAS